MTACRLDRGCGEDPCVCQPPAKPYPKTQQLAQHERRRFRHKATKTEWARIVKAKLGPCRVCMQPGLNGGTSAHAPYPISFHHLVPRSLGGDDVEDNIVPLCGDGVRGCHGLVESRDPLALRTVHETLLDAEYAYIVGKLGEAGPERLFGVGRG